MDRKEYIGRVVYNQDPVFSGRCKIRVFGTFFEEIPDDNLPWFAPMNMTVFSSGGGGNLSVPKIGDIVRVWFSNDDWYSGEYGPLQNIDTSLIDEIKDDYDGTHVLLYDFNEDLIVLYQRMTGFKIYHKGSSIILSPDGTIQCKHQNNVNVIEIREDTIDIVASTTGEDGTNASGTINITSGNIVNVTANTINVDAKRVNLGNKPSMSAVNGEELVKVLTQIVTELASKSPPGSTLLSSNFNNILSNTVKLTK